MSSPTCGVRWIVCTISIPWCWGDGDTVVALWKELARVEALVCRQSATFDRCGDWALDGAQNAAAWVTTQARCDRTQARRRVRLGLAMRWIDLAHAAFVAGRIGIDHVDLLAPHAIEARQPPTRSIATRPCWSNGPSR